MYHDSWKPVTHTIICVQIQMSSLHMEQQKYIYLISYLRWIHIRWTTC